MSSDVPFLLLPLVALIVAGATYVVCRWRFARQMQAIEKRLAHLEASRQSADERTQQARRQVEQLQKDLTAARSKAAAAGKGAPAAAPAAAAATPASRLQDVESLLLEGDRAHAGQAKGGRPVRPAHGFADTLPMGE